MGRGKIPRMLGLLAFTALGGMVDQAPIAGACAIDGVPSLQADGTRVVLTTVPRTRQNSAHWAEFSFPRRFPSATPIRFSEDLRELARTLPPQILHGRWIWQWGDGGHGEGYSVAHRYARTGAYIVTVAVAVPHRAAFLFDTALIQIAR